MSDVVYDLCFFGCHTRVIGALGDRTVIWRVLTNSLVSVHSRLLARR